MNVLELRNISKKFPEVRLPAVDNFNLNVAMGEIVALLGESGCGKTTILRMIAGFEVPNGGTIKINGETVSGKDIFIEPQNRKVGIVFQDYALFPHKTVWENINFGLFRLSRSEATAIFVTHDTRDVMSIADKVSVIRQGRHVQTDNPEKIYSFPATAYVSDFFGKTNYIKAKVSPEGFKTPMGLIRTKTPLPADLKDVLLSIRHEEFTICNEKDNCFCGTIVSERFMGEYKELTCIAENLSG
ncbi:MAG: ABC transporter ATP-binding protein [Bacteroidales bacterium]